MRLGDMHAFQAFRQAARFTHLQHDSIGAFKPRNLCQVKRSKTAFVNRNRNRRVIAHALHTEPVLTCHRLLHAVNLTKISHPLKEFNGFGRDIRLIRVNPEGCIRHCLMHGAQTFLICTRLSRNFHLKTAARRQRFRFQPHYLRRINAQRITERQSVMAFPTEERM